MGKLDNKVALVSGAARGQGRSHAISLAQEGADIIALDLCADLEGNTYPLARPEDLEETVRFIEKEGVRVHSVVADVRERSAVWNAIADGVKQLGRLDIVVANAGICPMGKGQTLQSWSDTIDTDLAGVFNVVQGSLPHLGEGASIIATGSLAAQLGSATNQGPGGSAYSLAKQMVARYVNDLAVQLAKKNIRINAVHPTNVNTDMLHNEGMYKVFRPDLEHPTREEAEVAFPAMQAMRVPYIEPKDVSEAVVFLASDSARFITGTQLRIDAGGYVKSVPWKG
ncbi:mycofactocin-coupled SDR family oxidoreductase [Gordonia hankookensis]|uniref:Mycofactocin-coupled SDR family oxidoreductase n=1 Tax=Gordonia hankookensis TaxID=589403 RepID=A0ABR7WC05_9ACTN|nr:mycofactocin-coupled SDR family oxidoreductase [Gordonia hankookensis]MBD1319352.1 mycofactocin-coupled SDR family oxidoreductase [Gordonia hankookensis]NDZ97441.1 mycofactocin-coupled SDR family oxidoreductase [Streptomyces sp. SID11726]NEB27088.1 mycofactocin-coupled SDR family oxidoreductase [Streptomyces sp. SID6673]